MKNRQFTRTELKHLKFLMMRRGYTEEQASRQISELIETATKNYREGIKHKDPDFQLEFKKLKEKKNASS